MLDAAFDVVGGTGNGIAGTGSKVSHCVVMTTEPDAECLAG